VHDAILIEASMADIEEHVAALRACMREAIWIVVDGFELGSEAKLVRWPEYYSDKRGAVVWSTVTRWWPLRSKAAAAGTPLEALPRLPDARFQRSNPNGRQDKRILGPGGSEPALPASHNRTAPWLKTTFPAPSPSPPVGHLFGA
jgi:hypothetical protein